MKITPLNLLSKNLRLLMIPSVLFLTLGCISKHHYGINLLDDGIAMYRGPVAKKYIKKNDKFENNCAKWIINVDIDKIKMVMTSELTKKVDFDYFIEKINNLKDKNELTGMFKKMKMTKGFIWLDEMISMDPFKVYSLVRTTYILEGKNEIHLILLMTRKDDQIMLWGFEIHTPSKNGEQVNIQEYSEEITNWTHVFAH